MSSDIGLSSDWKVAINVT